MDRSELWKKVKVVLEKGYEVTKDATVKGAKSVATYSREAGQLTKDKFQELRLSRQLAKQLAALGARVYELSRKSDNHSLYGDEKLKELLARTKELDQEWQKAQERAQGDMAQIRRSVKGKSAKK